MVYLIHKGLENGLAFTIMERVRKGMWNKIPAEEREKYVECENMMFLNGTLSLVQRLNTCSLKPMRQPIL